MPNPTLEEGKRVAPNGAHRWKPGHALARHRPGWIVSPQGSFPGATTDAERAAEAARLGFEWLSCEQIVERLNEPLVECGDCKSMGYFDDPEVDYPCTTCNRNGTIDPHASLRAFMREECREPHKKNV